MGRPAVETQLRAFFNSPPSELETLDAWLTEVSGENVRATLLGWLAEDRVPAERYALVAYLLWRVGIGGDAAKLAAVVMDPVLTVQARAVALSLLSEHAPEWSARVLEEVPPGDHLALATAPIDDVLSTVRNDAGESVWIADMLAETPAPVRLPLFDRLEARRAEVELPAVRIYGAALGHPQLSALGARMLDRIIDDDLDAAIRELEALEQTSQGPLRARLARALVRLRTAALDEQPRRRPPSWAYVSGCDGVGDFLLIIVERHGEQLRIFDLMLRASGDVREAEAIALDPEMLPTYFDDHVPEAFLPLVRVPREAAELLFADTLRATRAADRKLPARIAGVVAELERACQAGTRYAPVEPTPLRQPDEMARLLETRLYATWRLHIGDLAHAGVEVPSRTRRRAFVDRAAPRLATPAVRRRLGAMARHMARIHAWRGETHYAQVMAAASEGLAAPSADSELLRLLLERAFDEVSGRRPRHRLEIGSPEVRSALREGLFSDLDAPTKSDLLRLDVTEAACAAIEEVFEMVPREQRPRDSELLAFASCVGQLYVDCLLDNVPTDALIAPLGAELADLAAWPQKACEQLAALLVERLGQFSERVCARCPVKCSDRPRSPARRLFWGVDHPAEKLL